MSTDAQDARSPPVGGTRSSAAAAASSSSAAAAESASATAAAGAGAGAGPIICPGHSRPVPDLAFTHDTPDGVFLVSACLDNKAMLRDGQTGDWIGTFMGHKGAVWCARMNTPATQAATAAGDFSAKLWDALSGAELATLPHKHIVKSVCFSADGSRLYTGGAEKKLRIWDLARPDKEEQLLEEHKASISNVLTVQDENLIVTIGGEKDARIWDRRTNSVVKRLPTPAGDMRFGQTTLDGKVLSVSSSGKEVAFYDTTNWQLIKKFSMPREIDCVSFDPVHKRFLTGCMTELWVRVYDFNTGEEIACNKGHHGPVRSLAFTPSYSTYASGSEDGTIRIWSWAGLGLEEQLGALKLNNQKDEREKAIDITNKEPKA